MERERRFLLRERPPEIDVTAIRRITDRYLVGTRLRLRQMEQADGTLDYKLTQKIPGHKPGAEQGLITTLYLSRAEYDLLTVAPATVLTKTRLSVPPLGVDVFDPPLEGLILAEAEFITDEAAASFQAPANCVAEVTNDARFTGGSLALATRIEVLRWLAEYGI